MIFILLIFFIDIDSFTYTIINQSINFFLQGALSKITTDESLLPESKTMSLFLCKDFNTL